MVGWEITQACQHRSGFFFSIMVDQPTRREGHEKNAAKEDGCWEELQADRYEPSSFMLRFSASADVIGAYPNTLISIRLKM
jgi:hypothetical protein